MPALPAFRCFPRGIHREQQLDKQKELQDGFSKKFKPVDAERNLRDKFAGSLKERKMMRKADVKYGQFVKDEVIDPDLDKMLDNLIDEKMAAGKTDEQILAELGAITGMAPQN